MLGMRTWLVFVSVILGNFLSVGCWILFFDSLKGLTEKLPVSLPLVILLTVVGLACAYRAWTLRQQIAHRFKNGRNGARPPAGTPGRPPTA
jgi:hypothetical protein